VSASKAFIAAADGVAVARSVHTPVGVKPKWYGVEPWKGLFRNEVVAPVLFRTCPHCSKQSWWQYVEKMTRRTTINFIPVSTTWFYGIVCPNCSWGFTLGKSQQRAAKELVAKTGAWVGHSMSDSDYMAACEANPLWRRFADKAARNPP
jgi:hypothetical protein